MPPITASLIVSPELPCILPGPPLSGGAFLSCPELAAHFDVAAEPLRKRLARWLRNAADLDYIENTERSINQPQFLYRLGAVQHLALSLLARSAVPSRRAAC